MEGDNTDYRPELLPQLPSAKLGKLIQRYNTYPSEYQALAQKFQVATSYSVNGHRSPTLEEVNAARVAANADFVNGDPGSFCPLGSEILPTQDDCMQPLNAAYGHMPAPTDQGYLSQVAYHLTAYYLIWQMYGTALALAVARARTFHQHGGRPLE